RSGDCGPWRPSGSRRDPGSAAPWRRGLPMDARRSTPTPPTSHGAPRTAPPMEQWASNRDVRLSPFNGRERDLGAVFYETAGWERPFWYESNRPLLDEYGDRVMPRQAEWEARWWSPIINAEHLAMRDRVAMVDLSAFAIIDIGGPGALDVVQRMAVKQMDVPVGRVVYTPLLNPAGGVKADLTIMRLSDDRFRAAHGGFLGTDA